MRVGSLFAGIEGFGLAFTRAGFTLAWSVEVDASCRKVIERHFPDIPIFNDVRTVHGRSACQEDGCELCLPAVDVLVGGWPCQPFSVAGRRRGTDDERDLWPEFARLIGELSPAWMVGENVPGLLSIDEGQVWARTVTDLDDLGYGVAWRVCDAQHFGVPQRRRRIFVVGCAGDVVGPAKVLFDEPGGEGDFTAGGEAGTGVAGDAARGVVSTLQGGGRRGHRLDVEGAGGGGISSLTAKQGGPDDNSAQAGHLIAAPLSSGSNPNSHAAGRRREGDENLAIPLDMRNVSRLNPATGVGTPSTGIGEPGDPAFGLSAEGAMQAIAHTVSSKWAKGTGVPAGDEAQNLITHALSSEGADASEDGTGRGTPIIAFQNGQDFIAEEGLSQPVTGSNGQPPSVSEGMAVRRLMPVECERLMGLPDGWTEGQSDSIRYRQLGNSVAIPVVEWIARRLLENS